MARRVLRDPLLAFVLALAPLAARAQAPLSITSETPCPSADHVRAELPEASASAQGEDAWRVSIVRAGARVIVTLRRPGGELAGARTFRSRDCASLAAVVAEVVRAQLVELRVWAPAPAAGEPEPAPMPEAPAPPEPELAVEPAPPALPRPPPAPPSHEERSAARVPLRLAIAGGLRVESEGPRVAGLGALAVTGAPFGPVLVRGRLSLASPIELGAGRDRVRLVDGGVRAGIGVRSDQALIELEAVLEAGIELSHVTALGFDGQPSELRVLPVVGFDAGAVVTLVGPLALRLDATASVPCIVERYLVEPGGQVARSAPFVLDVTLGLELAL